MNELRVGFIAWAPNYGAPGLHAAAPAPGNYQIGTIGGPRTLEQIQAEIAAIENHLDLLKSEMSGHPDYRRSPSAGEQHAKE